MQDLITIYWLVACPEASTDLHKTYLSASFLAASLGEIRLRVDEQVVPRAVGPPLPATEE